jgi:hypothetical protein
MLHIDVPAMMPDSVMTKRKLLLALLGLSSMVAAKKRCGTWAHSTCSFGGSTGLASARLGRPGAPSARGAVGSHDQR